MKKSSMHTIIAYMYTILFQLYGSKAGVFEDNLFWEGKYDPPPPSPTFILKELLEKVNVTTQPSFWKKS